LKDNPRFSFNAAFGMNPNPAFRRDRGYYLSFQRIRVVTFIYC